MKTPKYETHPLGPRGKKESIALLQRFLKLKESDGKEEKLKHTCDFGSNGICSVCGEHRPPVMR